MQEKYPLPIRILHWLMALMIIGLLAVGLYMTGLSHDNPQRAQLYSLHKSFGITVLMLAVMRLGFRLKQKAPALPAAIPPTERKLGELGHWALYGFMFVMPLSGYLMSTYYGLSVKWFGAALPKIVGVNKLRGGLASDIHTYAAYALIGMLALHMGAVALHYFKERVNLLRRMT